MSLTTITNNQYREILSGYDIPESAQNDFDYMDDITEGSFFKYRGQYYSLDNFMVSNNPDLSDWDAMESDTFFSATVIKLSDCGDSVLVGRIYS